MLYDQWPWPLQESESGFTYYVHYLNVLTFSISDLSNILPTWSNIWTGIRQKEYQWNNIAQDNILFGRCGWYFQSFLKVVGCSDWMKIDHWDVKPKTTTKQHSLFGNNDILCPMSMSSVYLFHMLYQQQKYISIQCDTFTIYNLYLQNTDAGTATFTLQCQCNE